MNWLCGGGAKKKVGGSPGTHKQSLVHGIWFLDLNCHLVWHAGALLKQGAADCLRFAIPADPFTERILE